MRALLIGFLMTWLVAACATTQGTTPSVDTTKYEISRIQLSNTRGEVGRPFLAKITYDRQFEDPLEFDVAGLPDGLRFDPNDETIVGKASRAGFFTVTVGIRRAVEEDRWHRPKPEERWYTEDVSVEIYAPMRD